MAKRLAFSDNLPLRDKRVADRIPNLMSATSISRGRARVHEMLHSGKLEEVHPSPPPCYCSAAEKGEKRE